MIVNFLGRSVELTGDEAQEVAKMQFERDCELEELKMKYNKEKSEIESNCDLSVFWYVKGLVEKGGKLSYLEGE